MKTTHKNDYEYLLTLIDMLRKEIATVTVNIQSNDGVPLGNICVTNLTDENGASVITNSYGTCTGYVSASSGTFTPLFSNMIDIASFSMTPISVLPGKTYSMNVVATMQNFKRIDASAEYRLSTYYSRWSYSIVGGGGGGAAVATSGGSGGGGGGGCVMKQNEAISGDRVYIVTIGNGGTPGNAYSLSSKQRGYSGGASSISGVASSDGGGGGNAFYYTDYTGKPNTSQVYIDTATGGSGGGNGGSAVYGHSVNVSSAQFQLINGQNGSVPYYTAFDVLSSYGPGGGGGYGYQSMDGRYGSAGLAGGGAAQNSDKGQDGINGGGGGAICVYSGYNVTAGRGGAGFVTICLYR